MDDNPGRLRKRHGLAVEENASIVPSDKATCTSKSEPHSTPVNGSINPNDAKDEIVWGKTNDGTIFKVPTTHDVLTLFNPYYPKSHFDLLSLFLLGSQVVLFFAFLDLHRKNPDHHYQTYAKAFFLAYFIFWRAMYDGGLGWVLTKQSKRRWIVNLVRRKAWFDEEKRPKVRAWLRKQLEYKMGKDYKFDDLPLEYNTWLLFRQVVDIILLNDFLSYVIFAFCNLDVLFPASGVYSFTSHNPGTLVLRLLGGVALLLFNLWVKTSAHDVVKDYGWYWGDCFFSRGYLRKTRPVTTLLNHEENGIAGNGHAGADHQQQEESTDLQFDLTFDGIFEMAPHPMYSVGYAGYYGVSLLASSYPVFFVSLAAHAAQFAFLNFFENPHIERRYGVRKALADRTNALIPTIASPVIKKTKIEQDNTSRARSVSLGTYSEDTTAIDSENGDVHGEYDLSNGNGHHWNGVNGGIMNDAELVASITPPNGAREVVQEAVSQHDMLNKFFRKDATVLSGLDFFRASDQQLVLLVFYGFILSVIPRLNLSSEKLFYLHLAHALVWRIYYSFVLGLILKAQSESKFLVRHFLEHYHYAPSSLLDSPMGRGDSGVKEGAIKEAFDNWKRMFNIGMVMCYVSFIGFALQTYRLPEAWLVGNELLRHTLGALLIALHVWASRETYEVLGIFGWFFGDFFIDDYPASLNYTGIYRFLNNPERTMSGAAFFGIALVTGSKGVFTVAIFGHLLHLWFLGWVEGPHMRKLYGDSLRKDAGFTKMLKKLAKKNAQMFEDIHKQLALILEETNLPAKPEIQRVAKGVKEVSEKIGEVYIEGSEKVEEVWKRSGPLISEVMAETKALLKQSRERFVIPLLARDLSDYDSTKYNIYVIPTNPDGQLRFHWGEPINIVWRSPMRHSRRDWVGIYRYGANKSQTMTKTSSLGLWVPVHDEEWDGDVPRPLTDRNNDEETECGEIVFKNSTLPWQVGEYELRYHHDGKYNVVAMVGPVQIYLDRPDELDFKSIRQWLLKIVILALDSDPSLIPRSQTVSSPPVSTNQRLPRVLSKESNGSSASIATAIPDMPSSRSSTPLHYDIHDDDFRLWSERQAKRISYAISQVLDIDFAPEVIVADANVTALTRRILASKELLGP
ncbi:hypothetical protein CPB86DRAFT_783511 [Serendipita vermifera]|nr:hypothetical protein CPB86DRAFT_783511 [Serendipita vermifera]